MGDPVILSKPVRDFRAADGLATAAGDPGEVTCRFYQAQRMAALGELVGEVAHEFGNLLSVILCYGELVIDSLEPGHSLHGGLLEIRNAATRASRLVGQLLTLSRERSDTTEPTDLNRHVESMVRMLGPILGDRIRMIAELAPDLSPVRVSPAGIDQVLLNLALNSRDAMPRGGDIRIETGNVDRGVRLSFSDTGHGMDAATMSHIFEPFFTTKPGGQGTGLGLSTLRSIVTGCGGTVSVESEISKGATFRIDLPRFT
jgi:two-component system cell cycle sensor histidine kinase/response regulator CckA